MSRTVSQAVADLTARFTAVDPDTARLDARILVADVLGVEPGALFSRGSDIIPVEAEKRITERAERRLQHEPVSRILGRREFWGMDFIVTPDTLDPRADTETLVTAVLDVKSEYTSPRILDLGTGSGCILLAVLRDWPYAHGVGVDLNPGAVAVARENAAHLGLSGRASFRQGNWCEGISDMFEIVVSNPPYITDDEMAALAPDVSQYDPELALRGGPDGLAAYRALIPQARSRLAQNGRIYLEIGAGQEKDVGKLLMVGGFSQPKEHKDLAGIVRCLEAVTV